MLVKIDFDKTSIELDGKKIDYLDGYSTNLEEFQLEYSVLKFKIGKYFVVDDINYSELITFLFYQNDNYFTRAPGIITILNYLEILDRIKEKSELTLEIDDMYYDTFKKCVELVSMKKKFKINIAKEKYTKRGIDFIYSSSFFVRNLLKLRISARYLLGVMRKILKKNDSAKTDVILLSNIRFEGSQPKDNMFFGEVIKELDERKISNKVLKYEDLIQLVTLKYFIEKFSLKKQAYIGDYYSINHFLKCNKDFNLLRKKWNHIKNNPDFKKIFTYKGYNYYDIIKPKLELTFNALSYIACDSKNIAKKIIEKEKYKVLVLDHEENIYGKSFMLNNRVNTNRKTLALSFEIIWLGSVHVCARNKIIQNRNSLLWRPLPDIKCVWSQYSKDVLVDKCNYQKNLIRITGNPKFDFLFKTKYDQNKVIEKYHLSKTRRKMLCVLWSPGGVSDINYLDDYNSISKQIGNIEFIIKPHPRDINIERIKEKIKMFKNPLLKYVNNKDDIYPVIQVSDYVLTNGSTVGFEGLINNKISFGWFPDDIDLPPFLKGAVQIKELSMLKNEFKKLEDKLYQKKLLDRTKALRELYHYKNDGMASKRVTDEIEKLLSTKD